MSVAHVGRAVSPLGWFRTVVLPPLLVVVIILGGWQLTGLFLDPLLISTPTGVFGALVGLSRQGEIWIALLTSLEEMFIGLAIGLVLGILLGLLMGRYWIVEKILSPYVNFFNATPLVVTIPLLVIWVGISTQARLLFVVLITIWPVLLNTLAGVRNVSQGYVDVGRAFGLSEAQMLRQISIPAAVPYILAGVRISVGLAIIGMIISEIEVSMVGLGFLLTSFGNSFQTSKLFAVILVTSLLGVLSAAIVRFVERRWFHWIGDLSAAEAAR
jgi:NitT/TauT family transport system permease protein